MVEAINTASSTLNKTSKDDDPVCIFLLSPSPPPHSPPIPLPSFLLSLSTDTSIHPYIHTYMPLSNMDQPTQLIRHQNFKTK